MHRYCHGHLTAPNHPWCPPHMHLTWCPSSNDKITQTCASFHQIINMYTISFNLITLFITRLSLHIQQNSQNFNHTSNNYNIKALRNLTVAAKYSSTLTAYHKSRNNTKAWIRIFASKLSNLAQLQNYFCHFLLIKTLSTGKQQNLSTQPFLHGKLYQKIFSISILSNWDIFTMP